LQANEAVCLVEVEGAPVLSPPVGLELELCGTENFGDLGKIRSWKAVSATALFWFVISGQSSPFCILLRVSDVVRNA
jgi:hypothetical protein